MESSRTFKDSLDREWTVEITLANARRMKEAAGISIEQLAPDMSGKAKSRLAAIAPVLEFLGDPFQAFEAFHALVLPQAEALHLSKDQVMEGFADTPSVERMVAGIMAAVELFFRKSPKRLATARMVTRQFETFLAKMNEKVNGALDKIDFGKALDAMPEIDVAAVNADIAARLRNSAIDSAATSALIPSATP